MGYVYMVQNAANGKLYIGKTVATMAKRKREHESAALKNSHLPFHRALCKYGFDAFEWKVLFESSNEDKLNQLEIETIWGESSKSPNGYNLTDGGEGVSNPSEEVRAKYRSRRHSPESNARRSIALKGKSKPEGFGEKISRATSGKKKGPQRLETIAKRAKSNTGKRRSEETKIKISTALMGHPVSEEAKIKMRKSHMGKRHSEETKARMRKAHKNRIFLLEEAKNQWP